MATAKESIDIILDCFGGADGGVGFAKLNWWVQDLEKRDDDASKQLLDLLHKFAKLVNVVANGKS